LGFAGSRFTKTALSIAYGAGLRGGEVGSATSI
jgi:hypothetical protein